MADIKAGFQFIDHRIKRLEIKNGFSDLLGRINYQLSLEVADTPATEENENGDYVGYVSLIVKAKGESPELDGQSISIVLEVEGGFFACKNDVPLEAFNEMLQINGLTTMYTIARCIIISVSAQCCPNGQVRIPMLNMMEVRKAIDEAEEAESRPEPSSISSQENE